MYMGVIFMIGKDVHGRNATLEGVLIYTSTHICISHC